jgi:hypothetical protein
MSPEAEGLPVCRAAALPVRPPQQRWLVETLWSERAVGVVGGEPKCGKSFLALDLALSVASGAPCLRRFAVPQPGPVLLYAAEDAAPVVRERLAGIAAAAGVPFDASLELHVITAPRLRLDDLADRRRLRQTVAALRPRLLVLDPFVRLHRCDENAVAEVAPLLAGLRALERDYATSVLLVHHARKGAAGVRAGQALRGSSELHAWGDSNLYLRRHAERLVLSVEHRAAPSPPDLVLELRSPSAGPALHRVTATAPDFPRAPRAPSGTVGAVARVHDILARASRPLTRAELRDALRLRTTTLGEVLAELVANGTLRLHAGRYQLGKP